MSMKGKTSKHLRITSTVDGKYKVCTEFNYDCTAQEPTMLYVIRAPSRIDNAATTSIGKCAYWYGYLV